MIHSGVLAFENGRMAKAIRNLVQARDRLRTLRSSAPDDARVASLLATSLGFLASAL